MKCKRFTEEDSTKNVPHYEINCFDDTGEWLGHYQIKGHWLEQVFVSKKMRNKGICKKLVKNAVSRKKNLKLIVKPNNTSAIKCYESVGFVFVKELDTKKLGKMLLYKKFD